VVMLSLTSMLVVSWARLGIRGRFFDPLDGMRCLAYTSRLRWLGSAEGRDGYDAIEHIAALDWCTGKTALVGNSWLAMAQWFIAAEQPPSLTCIAPLEGCSDFYRETLCRGGVPNTPFWELICSSLFGESRRVLC
jgi:predicted acyl esterase